MQQANKITPTLHQPLHSKVSNYLNNQRRTGQFCDLILELENYEEALALHFCVVASQSGYIGSTHFLQKSQQFSIHNPLKITLKNFNCLQCFHTMADFFYEDIVSIPKEHEEHFQNLAKMLSVNEILNLFHLLPAINGNGVSTHDIGDIPQVQSINQQTGDINFDNEPNYFKLKNPRACKSSSKINYCIACDFKCYPVQKMIAHMSSCEPSQLTCSLCEIGFVEWREYDAHLRKHSVDLKKPFICLECDTRFVTRAALMIHQPKHTTETPHVCTHCGKGFKWKQGLNNHILIHNTEKQMLCDVCGYSTTHMKALKSHKLQHTGDLFKCTIPGCNHRANRKENMKLHIETHKQERHFICEVCGCKFSQSKNLRRHALKHTENGPKRYSCQLCGFCSHRSDKIKEHMQRMHTEKGIQLELPETVESSFENKVADDFNLPLIDEKPNCLKITKLKKNAQGKSRYIRTKTKERRLKKLLPKSSNNSNETESPLVD